MSSTTIEIVYLLNNIFGGPVFNIIGGVTTLIVFLGMVYSMVCYFFGLTPILFRLGNSLWNRDIAIFATDENFSILKETIENSRIFRGRNICQIKKDNFSLAKEKSIFLIDWESSKEDITEILSLRKNSQTGVIIFAESGSIDQTIMKQIANERNTVVVNFKGRLLNDILNTLVTTSFKK